MKRLRLLLVLFMLALAVPLALVVLRTYTGLRQEETARLAFFAQTIFDAIEGELTALVEREENRPVDAYHETYNPPGGGEGVQLQSPLAGLPEERFILGYLQNNPDGSFQTPLAAGASAEVERRRAMLATVNLIFNQKKSAAQPAAPLDAAGKPAPALPAPSKAMAKNFADQFLASAESKAQRSYLGRQKAQRVEEITAGQAANIVREERLAAPAEAPPAGQSRPADDHRRASRYAREDEALAPAVTQAEAPAEEQTVGPLRGRSFLVEVAPLQSVFIDQERVFIFRRIGIDNRIYRQGFVLSLPALLHHLGERHFASQPMAGYAHLGLAVADGRQPRTLYQAGAIVAQQRFAAARQFPAPFDFLSARLASAVIPPSDARPTLNLIVAVLAGVLLIGLGAIYHSARTLVDLSERRTRFVSSVTHELKTPLTNIRLYIEMLAQGIAGDTAREQDYLQILGNESARLGRLIDNVLELARLERKQRRLNLIEGAFESVLQEVQALMDAQLRQEDFHLEVAAAAIPTFAYDREVMLQILLNLIENSIKFGRRATRRLITLKVTHDTRQVYIAVADTGPGIPRAALKKVFDDFYRVEDALTGVAGGTGLGLALVRRFVAAMGGSVSAANNPVCGCTITIALPRTLN